MQVVCQSGLKAWAKWGGSPEQDFPCIMEGRSCIAYHVTILSSDEYWSDTVVQFGLVHAVDLFVGVVRSHRSKENERCA